MPRESTSGLIARIVPVPGHLGNQEGQPTGWKMRNVCGDKGHSLDIIKQFLEVGLGVVLISDLSYDIWYEPHQNQSCLAVSRRTVSTRRVILCA